MVIDFFAVFDAELRLLLCAIAFHCSDCSVVTTV